MKLKNLLLILAVLFTISCQKTTETKLPNIVVKFIKEWLFVYSSLSLHSVINSGVIASIASKTLYRCLPDGVGKYKRQKHQRHPKNPPNTKCAA